MRKKQEKFTASAEVEKLIDRYQSLWQISRSRTIDQIIQILAIGTIKL